MGTERANKHRFFGKTPLKRSPKTGKADSESLKGSAKDAAGGLETYLIITSSFTTADPQTGTRGGGFGLGSGVGRLRNNRFETEPGCVQRETAKCRQSLVTYVM